MTSPILDVLFSTRLVAIVRLPDLSKAIPLTEALLAGGIRVLEFTLTNPDALRVIREVRAAIPDFQNGQATIGVGSVRQPSEVEAAAEVGAQFIVSPILRRAVVETTKACGLVSMPGAYTPSEIADAWDMGADVVKVFPATSLGPGYFKDVLAPMPELKLMPTGGVGLDNMQAFFKAGCVAVGVGSALVDKAAIDAENWQVVTDIATKYAHAAKRV